MTNDRRGFFRWTLGGATSLALGGPLAAAESVPRVAEDEWLGAIARRKHKAFLDVRSFTTDGAPFRRATNLLTVLQESYGASPGDIGVAFGAHGTALGYLMTPAIWAEFNLVEKIAPQMRPAEASTLREAGRNWAALGADGVRDLRARGVRVLACRMTIARWARDFATARSQPADDVVRKLISGLHEGVEPVPAMIAAAVLAQSRDLGYVAIE